MRYILVLFISKSVLVYWMSTWVVIIIYQGILFNWIFYIGRYTLFLQTKGLISKVSWHSSWFCPNRFFVHTAFEFQTCVFRDSMSRGAWLVVQFGWFGFGFGLWWYKFCQSWTTGFELFKELWLVVDCRLPSLEVL